MPDDSAREFSLRLMRAEGVPDPDGTALGDAEHTLSVTRRLSDDLLILAATTDVYAPGETTGISLGDLRELVHLARMGKAMQAALDELGRTFP